MRTYICATIKISGKPGLALGTTSGFTIPKDSTNRSDIKHPTKSTMLRGHEDTSRRRRARSPHGGIGFSSFGGWRTLPLSSWEDLEGTTPGRGILAVFSLSKKCWKRKNYEVNKFNEKNCLDKWVHYNVFF